MAEINITINGRVYGIACDNGQEQRVVDLGRYIDHRVREIARAGAATNESHLLVLTSLVLADEIFDLKDGTAAGPARTGVADEDSIVEAIDHLAARINLIAGNLQKL